ncbi:MAG TPA: hypothetical protein VNV85_12250 [Puia sp.]|jgi:hypothetical protein|nr:hypothetical protein [Puia sp.]
MNSTAKFYLPIRPREPEAMENALKMKNTLTGFIFLIATLLTAQIEMVADSYAVHSIHGIVKEMLRLISVEKVGCITGKPYITYFYPCAYFTVVNHGDLFTQPVETVNLDERIKHLHDGY